MKKLPLLDADVIIDLHTRGLFDGINKSFEVCITKTVLDEALYFKSEGAKAKINVRNRVTVIENVAVEHLQAVRSEAKEARLGIDPGETEAIACLMQAEKSLIFCTCDKAAIKLLAFMTLKEDPSFLKRPFGPPAIRKKPLPQALGENI